jgi:hypothetical protein
MFRVEERDRVQRQLLARAGADGGLMREPLRDDRPGAR